MQTIQTMYSNGYIRAKCWNGWTRTEYDAALSSEQNHRAAAEKLIAKLNANKSVSWGILVSAPAVPGVRDTDNGWVFIIGYIPEIAPMYMSITVRFMPGTNNGPAYMKVFSWLFPNGMRVNYSRDIDPTDTQQAARAAAAIMLERINEKTAESGIDGYRLHEYIQAYNGDRVFSLRYL